MSKCSFLQNYFRKQSISQKLRKIKTNFNYYLLNQHKLKKIFSFDAVYFTNSNENLFEKVSNAMVNGMKNHKKIENCVFAAIHVKVSRLVKQSYRLEAYSTVFDQINQVSVINPPTYKRK